MIAKTSLHNLKIMLIKLNIKCQYYPAVLDSMDVFLYMDRVRKKGVKLNYHIDIF